MKMITRRFHLILILLTGLFVFQGTMVEALPREKVRIELVEKRQKEITPIVPVLPVKRIFFPNRETLQKPQVERPRLLSLMISYQQNQSTR
jgi:hypothetical protein